MKIGTLDTQMLGLRGLVLEGRLAPVLPTIDSGWKSYGQGRLFLPAATNYCTNPSFEVDSNADGAADGWSVTSGNGASYVASLMTGVDGKKRQSVAVTGAGSTGYGRVAFTTAVGTFVQNDYITASFEVEVPSVVGAIQLNTVLIFCNAGGTALTSANGPSTVLSAPSSGVLRFSQTLQATHADTSKCTAYVQAALVGYGESVTMLVGKVLIEKSSVLTPYFDGSYPGCAWTGAANASTSTRAKSTLKYLYSPLTDVKGTVAARIQLGSVWSDSLNHWYVAWLNSVSTQRAMEICKDAANNWSAKIATSEMASSLLGSGATGSTHGLVGRFDGILTVDLNVDGVNAVQRVNANTAVTPNTIEIGDLGAAGRSASAYIGSVLISPARKSDAWTAAIQANLGAAFSDLMRLYRDFMDPGDLLIPLNGDSVAYLKVA